LGDESARICVRVAPCIERIAYLGIAREPKGQPDGHAAGISRDRVTPRDDIIPKVRIALDATLGSFLTLATARLRHGTSPKTRNAQVARHSHGIRNRH
jgi:hypothetical protein